MAETMSETWIRWTAWLAPAGIIGMMSIAFSVGMYVGRQEVRLDMTRLAQDLESHRSIPRHSGAMSAELLDERWARLDDRLTRIEGALRALELKVN